jgi:hypothetical protein
MPVIPATQEVSPGNGSRETLSQKQKDWGHRSRGGAITWHAQGPGFNLQYEKRKVNKRLENISLHQRYIRKGNSTSYIKSQTETTENLYTPV